MAGVIHNAASSLVHGLIGSISRHEKQEASSLLHGALEVTIYEATHLNSAIKNLVIQPTEDIQKVLNGKLALTRLFAAVEIGAATVARTRLAESQSNNPKWNQTFRVYCAHSSPSVVISIQNQLDLVLSPVVARATIPASQLLTGKPVQGWFDLFRVDGHRLFRGKLHADFKYIPVADDLSWGAGLTTSHRGLSNAFFPLRTGCDVTLYHDAHTTAHFDPEIKLGDGRDYRPTRLWEDLCSLIDAAKHFIYVAGWSVNVNITLVRDDKRMIPGASGVTLGELLRRKADDGVAVLVMPWNDRTTFPFMEDVFGKQLIDQMKTRDEETFKFFRGTKVKCFRCNREGQESIPLLEREGFKHFFSHHQKTVSLDAADAVTGARKVVSFVGGVDLCGGRYDDENHTLFKSLYTTYRQDFLQGNFDADIERGGPREPWHDIHSKLEGGAAWDVVTNFEQRWQNQAPTEIRDYLVRIRERPQIFPPPSGAAGSWSVQVFRSIDSASAVGFPTDPGAADKMGLMSGRNVTFEQSIHSAYVEAIRRANRFVYIENQYFFGGCTEWAEDRDCGCSNLVPVEIALKVADKIRRGERFAAYVVTPMWPEGKPEDYLTQGILHWNRLTMEMMHRIVAAAIKEKGLTGSVHPCDFLNFFCLGNRETSQPGEYVPPRSPVVGSHYWLAQKNRRFPIYVHSKLMIVDDEYIIVGSANLNQRSLAGDRDSEIAQGAFQPAHLNSSGGARGDVYGFRMSLWHEHLGSAFPARGDPGVFAKPETLQCVRAVSAAAKESWSKFVGDKVVDLPGHLLPFPVSVSASGEVTDLPEGGVFPDTKAPVKGKRWTIPLGTVIPDLLTT